MNNIIASVIVWVIGYLFGNFSTGILVSKIFKTDIRKSGSGNVGSTNALRVIGLKGGLITFAGDLCKALVPALFIRFLFFPGYEGEANGLFSTDYFVLIYGLGVILGHNYPFWLKFKGGKGIASTGGTFLAFNPLFCIVLIAIFAGVVGFTGYVSLGSLIGMTALFIGTIILYPGKWVIWLLAFIFTAFAFFQHRGNIDRLIHHKENKFNFKTKKGEAE